MKSVLPPLLGAAFAAATTMSASAAGSVTTLSANGKTLTVRGAQRTSASTVDGVSNLVVDGHTVVIRESTMTVDGAAVPLPDYERIDVIVGPDGLRILADGQTIEMSGEQAGQ